MSHPIQPPSLKHARSIQRTVQALSLGLLCLLSSVAWAAPVNGVFTYHQPDASTLQVKVIGDEFFAEEETLDGRHVIKDPVSKFWCYAKLSKDGQSLESTGIIARDLDPSLGPVRSVPEAHHLKTPTRQRMRIGQGNRERLGRDANGRILLWQTQVKSDGSKERTSTGGGTARRASGGPTVGMRKGLTLLVRFPDQPQDVTCTRQQVDNYCNQMAPHYNEFGNNGSVVEYFYDVSNGRLNYTNTVVDYYTAQHNRDYYTDPNMGMGPRAVELIKEALDAIEAANFDFRTVDADENGVIDAVNCFYAGNSVNSWADGLWPHMGSMSWTSAKTGIKANVYQITNMGVSLTLSTFCHENGHMLCLFPDVYDYDGDSRGGAGRYCLMDLGGQGTNPSPPNAYLRYRAGWGTAEPITTSNNVSKTLIAESNGRLANQFLIYNNPANSKEYFIIENRYKNDRDAELPSEGIAIWHVDEQGNHNDQNWTHQSSHANYEVALIQADNQRHFELNQNDGDTNDLFSAGNSASGYSNQFSDTSDCGPYDNNAHWWDGDVSGLMLSDFSAPGNTMSLIVRQQSPPIGITVHPASATIEAGTTKQFIATVNGSSDAPVIWSCTVDGGTVSDTGLYSAPSKAGTYTVTATSTVDPSLFASAKVTVTAPIVVTISPATLTLEAGHSYQFTASVSGTTNTEVWWETPMGGEITDNGTYTAWGKVGTYTITARSREDPRKWASACITVTISNCRTYYEVECNDWRSIYDDVPDTATEIVGTIKYSGDEDYFHVLVGAGKTLTVNMTGPSGKDYDLYLYDASGTQLLKSSTGSTATESVSYPNTGTSAMYYIIFVKGKNDNYSTDTFYHLAITRNGSPSTVSVSISPTTATVVSGATQQFTATVVGTSNTAVTWMVVPGSPGNGAVTPSGLFFAGTVGTCNVRATSVVDTTQFAEATVTIMPPPPVVSVSISPWTTTVMSGGTQQFTATVSGSSNTAVIWSCQPNGGTISATGLYTAPSRPGIYSVMATSVLNTSTSTQAMVAVVPVGINPKTVTMVPGATQAFNALLEGTPNTSVTWECTGGGTISPSGLYTAPDSDGLATVKAISVADPSQFATASVTVTSQPPVSVSLNRKMVTVALGASYSFTGTVTGTSNTAVNWTVVPGAPGGGSVDASGVFIANTLGTCKVKATSMADPNKFDEAIVNITRDGTSPDVYTAGLIRTKLNYCVQGYWKNGTWVGLPSANPAFSGITSLAVSGSDVYVAGMMGDFPGYWKNGTWVSLTPPSDAPIAGSVNSLVVSGNDVYVGGNCFNERMNCPGYWKNGIWVGLSLDSPYDQGQVCSLAVSGSDVYVGGACRNSSYQRFPGYWKNGIWVGLSFDLPNGNGSVNALVVSGSDVYAVGNCWNRMLPGYWKNGNWVGLSLDSPYDQGQAYSLAVSGSDVYFGGACRNGSHQTVMPGYWKNGIWVGLTVPQIDMTDISDAGVVSPVVQ